MNTVFKFNKSAFRIEYAGLKLLSKATINPRITYTDKNGQVVKADLPTAVARSVRILLKNVTRFTKDYPICIAFVDDRIVSIDAAVGPDYKMFIEYGEWMSVLESRQDIIDQVPDGALWDGQYAYTIIGKPSPIGKTGFGSQACNCLNLFRFYERNRSEFNEEMALFCFLDPSTNEWVKSSPIARRSGDLLQITGEQGRSRFADLFIDKTSDQLDQLDRGKFVNLRFVNYAAKALANQFGYESVEPLGLPLLMIEHRTFNVGGLSLSMQVASPAPLKFTRAMAWMVGLYRKVESLDDMITVKQTFKMLLSKGNTSIYQAESDDEAKQAKQVSTVSVIKRLRTRMESAPLITFDEP